MNIKIKDITVEQYNHHFNKWLYYMGGASDVLSLKEWIDKYDPDWYGDIDTYSNRVCPCVMCIEYDVVDEIETIIQNIKDTLHWFPTPEMELEYLIDLGKKSQENFPDSYRTKENFIHGCTSNAWIKLINKDPIQINTVSDSILVSGLLYLLEEAFNGEPKSSIDKYEGQTLIDDLGFPSRARWPLDSSAPFLKGPGLKL